MNVVAEIIFRLLFPILAEIVLNFLFYIAFNLIALFFLFFLRTGDYLMELATLDYFRDHSKVPVHKKPLHPVSDWASALLGAGFWSIFAAAAYLSWPALSSW